jgi:hypothetical protein
LSAATAIKLHDFIEKAEPDPPSFTFHVPRIEPQQI